MILFNGYELAQKKEVALTKRVAELAQQGIKLKIAAILFKEDAGSVLYTRLKGEAAERVDIGYEPYTFSMNDSVERILAQIKSCGENPSVTGIIIQKPWKQKWEEVTRRDGKTVQNQGNGADVYPGDKGNASQKNPLQFTQWWQALTAAIVESKDVDGLHPNTLAAIEANTWQEQKRVLPATCQAVLDIFADAQSQLGWSVVKQKKVLILGKSDLLGKPLYWVLYHQKIGVDLLGKKELQQRRESGQLLLDADVIVSATGQSGLVKGEMVKEGAVIVDVGEPKPDVDQITVAQKAAFLTPVPGGVGPMTIMCLLENAVRLVGK